VRLPRLVPIAADATLSLYADNTWLDVPCRVAGSSTSPAWLTASAKSERL